MHNIRIAIFDGHKISVKDIPEDYRELQKAIDCDCIDIVYRYINGKRYNIICDDEGRLVGKEPTMINLDRQIEIVGTFAIAGETDYEGNMTSLDNNDIELISNRIYFATGLDKIYTFIVSD